MVRLLIVEDSADDAALVVRTLETAGYEVEWARIETEPEMVDALASTWDAVIADYELPRFSAPRALALLQSSGLDLPFIVVSGAADEETTVAAMRAGAHDYVMKSNLRRLAPALERELDEARRRAEARRSARELQLVRNQMELVLQQVPCSVWTVDRDLRITSLYGHAADPGLVERTIPEADPENSPVLVEAYGRGLAGGRAVLEADWHGRTYLIEIEPLREDAGDIVGCIGVGLDVTERRRTEQALSASEARFRALIENSLDMIHVIAEDGTLLYASPSVERVLGYRAEELLGGKPIELVHPDDVPLVDAMIRAALDSRASSPVGQYRVRHRDGSWRTLEAVGLNLADDPAVGGMVVTSRDVTVRLSLQQRLDQSERLEAVGQLAGGVAHDFNNVLLVIRGYGSLLLEKLQDTEFGPELAEIVKAADRAASLTRQLLVFSRREVLQPRVLDVVDVTADLEPLLRRTIREDVELSIDYEAPAALVYADPTQIEQVIVNLVVNARDAMPRGGTVTVSVAEERLDVSAAAQLTPPVLAGDHVRLSVADTGTGIDPDALPHLFEPFFTTKEAGVGTGLGLSTVYGILAESGGGIRVESAAGEGATFTIYLPRAAADAGDAAWPLTPAVQEGGSGVGPSQRILLVEDEDPVRNLVARVLSKHGYDVVAVGAASDALAAAGDFDLLVSDVVMPEMSGYELAERLTLEQPGLDLLFISGYAHGLAQAGEIESGINLLRKPFTPEELLARVRATLDGPHSSALGAGR